MKPGRRGRTWIGLTLVPAILALGGCAEQAPSPAPEEELAFLNIDPTVGYVGREACRSCHFGKSRTYDHTGMGRSFRPLTPETAVADFTENNELRIEPARLVYRMTERDGRYYQRQSVLDANDREIATLEHEMLWALGSNHHNRGYLIEMDGKLFQAPVCWYPEVSRWELCPGYEHKNDHFSRETSDSCVGCHNGVMTLVEGERNRFHEPYPHGIGCELCHGPGRLHVERWKDEAETPTGDPDPTIVNPIRLTTARRNDICFQCHLGDARATERVLRHGRSFRDFRPGQRILEAFVPFRYAQSTQYDFGLSSQGDRMVLSRCYEASGGRLECLTCHDPHVPVYLEDRPADLFRLKCLGCHELDDCDESTENRQATAGLADDCLACHMRKAEPDDQRFTEFTDHWIRRDIDLADKDHRDRFDVEPIFPELLAGLPEGERAYYEARANFLLAADAPPSKKVEMWDRAESGFRAALELGFEEPDAWYFLGKTLLAQRRQADAEEAFRNVVELDPRHLDGLFAMGQAALARNDVRPAVELFRRMLEVDDANAMALAELGRAFMTVGDATSAEEAYRRAVAREPWNATLQMNLGRAMAAGGRFPEAVEQARTATRLDPDLPKTWDFYAQAARAAGLDDESAAAGRQRDLLRGARAGAEVAGHP